MTGPADLVGGFTVKLVPANAGLGTPASTTILGRVSDGPTPEAIVWETAQTSGACSLLKPRVPFCETACGSGVCVEDGVCEEYPVAKSVGTVTVTGVATSAGSTFTMDPVQGNYQPKGVTITYPGFDEGAAITFATSGGDLAAFTLESKGIRQLELSNTALTVESGKPLALTWGAAADAKASSIHVKLDISHHGGTKGKIECTTEDSGSLEIPAPLVTELLALGVAGFPTVVVTRRSSGTTQTEVGVVELDVESTLETPVTIPGLTSCSGDEDCPNGETCQSDLTCK